MRSRLGAERRLILLEFGQDIPSITAYLAALSGGHPAILVQPGCSRSDELVDAFRPQIVMRNGEPTRIAARGPDLHPDLALLMTTSGTSGTGRLVRLSRRNIEANARSIVAALGLTSGDRGALTLPLHYSYGLSILNSHLFVGGSVKLVATPVLDPGFVDAIDGCTNLSGVPYSYDLYERIGLRERTPDSLRMMTSAGGRLPPDLVRTYADFMERRGGRFFAMYGQTEATARIAILPPDRAKAFPEEIGEAVPGGNLSLDDGELVYRGPNVMMGYAETASDLARGDEVEFLRTGDLAERATGGSFRITGRKSRFSKIAGLRLGHEDAERKLAAEGVEAVVVGDDTIMVAVVSDEDRERDARDALMFATGLPRGHAESVTIADIPRFSSGKIDVPVLRERAFERLGRGRRMPTGVLAAFEEVFYPRPVRPADSFVSLGGDSLAFVQLSMTLEELLGRLPEGWEQRPISALTVDKEAPNTAALDTHLALRGPAALFVVLHHASQGPYVGGAAMMLLLAGYSLARFQGVNLFAGRIRPMLATLLRNAIPYFAVLALFASIEGNVPWQKWLLVGNLGIGGYTPAGTFHVIYWFVEAYAQIVVGFAILFMIPAVRRWAARDPLAFGLVLLGAALTSRWTIRTVWAGDSLRVFATPAVIYIFAFGWCIYFAKTVRQKIALSLLGLMVFPIADPPRYDFLQIKLACVLGTGALLLWVPRIRMPWRATSALIAIGAASYHIYLFHNIAPHFLTDELDVPRGLQTVINFGSGVALGVAAYRLQISLARISAKRRREAAEPESLGPAVP
ncbi:AMP-binding protein [Flaviflagellibacter deserti]|uniref:AMP-binding protein n=1 Tax=Flaviflagellibacter deserti TaxID=2267266 RepID=A0ABV9Z6B0_9HYPH